jgi:nitrogenase molybdenum-iron protein alpha/beta subunit
MSLNALPLSTSRTGGCTLTGALAVTTGIRDSVTIIHGPPGCAHHNFSLLHATILDNDCMAIPRVLSSGLTEQDIIFGGEEGLADAIKQAANEIPGIIFVLSTCIAETIGDDVQAVIDNTDIGIPVITVPTGGFLGGDFNKGFSSALIALSNLARPVIRDQKNDKRPFTSINLIGEKNLENEVKQNFFEVKRLVSLLGLEINIRFAHDILSSDIDRLPLASVNVLREPALSAVGDHLQSRLGMPYVASFPTGISGTLTFLKDVGLQAGLASEDAENIEKDKLHSLIDEFSDLRGALIKFNYIHGTNDFELLKEIASSLGFLESDQGTALKVPYPFPVGTNGLKRMFHMWRRELS